jgi:hypothetical protein
MISIKENSDTVYYDHRHYWNDPPQPCERRPFADWYSSQEVGLNHIDPIQDRGRYLPYVVMVPESSENAWKSVLVLRRLQEMDVSFLPWSSARCNVTKQIDQPKSVIEECAVKRETMLVFYFTDKKDAAIFKLIFESVTD